VPATEGHCEAPCVKSRSQNWDPTSWKSRPKSFQVSVLETARDSPVPGPARPCWPPSQPVSPSPLTPDGHCSQSLLATRTTCCPSRVRGRNFLPLHYIISRFRFCLAGLQTRAPSQTDDSRSTAIPVLVRLPRKEWRVGQTDGQTPGPPQIQKESRGSKWSKCPNKHHSLEIPELTAVAVPVLVRLPRKEWRVGQTHARTHYVNLYIR